MYYWNKAVWALAAAAFVAAPAFATPTLIERTDLGLHEADTFLSSLDFVAQARIGQPNNTAQTELSNGYDTSNPANFDEAHYPWAANQLSDFSLAFDGTYLTFDVGGTSVIWEDVNNQIDGNALVIRMRSTRTPSDGTYTGALLEIDDFNQGGTTSFNQSFSVFSTDVQGWTHVVLTGIDLSST